MGMPDYSWNNRVVLITEDEEVKFSGYVKICPGVPGDQRAWLCAAGVAWVFVDKQAHDFDPDCMSNPSDNCYNDQGEVLGCVGNSD